MAGKNQAKKWAVPVLAAVCLLCLAVMTIALICTGTSSQKEFTPPPFEKTAVSGTPEVPEELGWQELDAQAFRVSVCGAVVLEGSQADVWLANPESNTRGICAVRNLRHGPCVRCNDFHEGDGL